MTSEAQRLLDGPFAAAAAANDRQQQRQQQLAPSATAAGAAAASLPAGVRDVYADFNQLTLNITLSALFSMSTADDDDSSSSSSSSRRAAVIVAAVEKAFSYFAARGATAMVVPEWVPTPDNVAFRWVQYSTVLPGNRTYCLSTDTCQALNASSVGQNK
jgi:hypothetical protein